MILDPIVYDEFLEFYIKLSSIHKKCGEMCIHLKRFFMRLGFINQFYSNRRVQQYHILIDFKTN